MQQGHGVEAVAALIKKTFGGVVGAAKHALKNAHKARIHRPLPACLHFALSGDGMQRLTVDFARGGHRHGLKHMPCGGNHVRRQVAPAPRNNRFDVCSRFEHKKRGKTGLTASILNRQHGSLADGLAVFEQAGHFGQFHPVAANFYLIVGAPQQQDIPPGRPPGQIARRVKPRAALLRQAHKSLPGHIRFVVVAKGKAVPADPQFARHASGQLAPFGIADGERHIGDGPPCADGLRLKRRNFLHGRAHAGFCRAVGVEIAQ